MRGPIYYFRRWRHNRRIKRRVRLLLKQDWGTMATIDRAGMGASRWRKEDE